MLQLPIGAEGHYKGVIDLVTMDALVWLDEELGAKWEVQEIPADMVEKGWVGATMLGRLAGAPNVTVRGGERLLALEPVAGAVARQRLGLGSGASVEAALVVGADGARSAVRELCAIGARQRDSGQQAIVATIESAGAHRRTAWQRFLQSGPLALLPLA